MSLYVVAANQELLWKVISKNPYIENYFSQQNPDQKVIWFKNIISNFYHKYKDTKLSVTDLNSVNKETISFMIQNVREQMNPPINTPNNQQDYQPVNSYAISTPPIVKNNRQDIYANEFEQRQKEYERMNKRTVPEDINFTEKTEDTAIENMDTLIQQQLKQREYDMNNIPPPANMVSSTNTTPKLNNDNIVNNNK